jgi:MATE family multidrug resistance protein
MSFASSEVRAILKLTAPILATQLAQVGMGTIDTLMSGYVSTRDLAAVAIGSAVWTPVWLFLAGILVALSPAVAKANAANDAANLPKLLSTAIALGVTSGLILGALVAYIGWSIPVFVDDAHTAQVASQYLYAIAIGMPISGVFLALRFYAEALNDWVGTQHSDQLRPHLRPVRFA